MKEEEFIEKEILKLKEGLKNSTIEHRWWWNNRIQAAEIFLDWIKYQKDNKNSKNEE